MIAASSGGPSMTSSDRPTTIGVYTAANRAIRRSIGARPAWLARTWSTTREIRASPTGPDARTSSVPSPLTVPA